ncbi:tRNA (adenosine(37)-N6)-threonylcarbamoyltransferase complex dimerization subunit type 1 TsaB [Ornithinimicrobium sp. INDO-MA30-4]|uniref:tRNA (adenosine(37)-N6)-threonylcarbamoyltransferase complex dimerization subunit type 1 TsaB n=1 Tax=Ornithinimicrobium sp. INDO-MA30-4 TaxID=2908651 RepID=UPI001F1A90A6|nr:tRNA (adenosine(37)-N6)-threonylcarbamoyltransferase complex dimerization subunit type 1 TsaB [Ornithinimicrobium sp. INDO-MA30-4]UJH71517.1 tRNA (adenosine(37)-N6)-threonylcarbamoyltransferase complex dimerization subunit type 1 TsaB [Ornithinimicrobium sp. INDO-MA30-4]
MLLAIDTSTLTIGAAICDADGVLSQASESGTRAHAELLAPAIEEALHAASSRPADLDAVVVGVGPGPFTGLRVGIVTAAVMGHTLDIPVHGVCSLMPLPLRWLLATEPRLAPLASSWSPRMRAARRSTGRTTGSATQPLGSLG